MCHIGVIVVDNVVCAQEDRTIEEKLQAGMIFEHSGPEMQRASDAVGQSPTAAYVREIRALEFVGYTNMDDPELNNLYMPYPPFCWS